MSASGITVFCRVNSSSSTSPAGGNCGVSKCFRRRIRLAPGHYRVPDLSVYTQPAPRDPVFSTPPFIAIEILSADDRMSRIRRKIDDYLAFGVPYIWVIDPEARKADVYTPGGFYAAEDLILRTENPAIEVPLPELFAALDE